MYGSPYGAGKTVEGIRKFVQGLRFPKKYWQRGRVEKWVGDRQKSDILAWKLEDRHKKAIVEKFGDYGRRLVAQNPIPYQVTGPYTEPSAPKSFARNILGGVGAGFIVTEAFERISRTQVEKMLGREFVVADIPLVGEVRVKIPEKASAVFSVSVSACVLCVVTLANPIPTHRGYTFLGGAISVVKNVLKHWKTT